MQKKPQLEERLRDKTRLVIKVNYFSSIFSLIFCCICLFLLDITQVIPYVFLIFGILNLINTILYNYHRSLTLTYNIVSIMTLTGASIITCLLYTSDAADDLLCVDLGGRRII